MKKTRFPRDTAPAGAAWPPRLLVVGAVLIILLALVRSVYERPAEPAASKTVSPPSSEAKSPGANSGEPSPGHRRAQGGTQTAEEIVAARVSQFGHSRLEVARAMARRFEVEMPEHVEAFFDAVKRGQWEELSALFSTLSTQVKSDSRPESLRILWPAILETYGVAEQAHEWPADKLLDYGQAILGSLRPGMIYVGGTDPGRFIPTLLNETGDQSHIIFTQNAFADASYLQYAGYLYGDRLPTLSEEDSQRAFQDYLSDAQQRLLHDQQFPDEPAQIRPGEDIRLVDGRIQVSGQIAVMAINEKLLLRLMEKNPDESFAIEQSFPFQSTYAEATPLGPIMELRVTDEQSALTHERAAAALEYWRIAAQGILADPVAGNSAEVRKTWSKMAADQGALFLDRHFPAEAEQVLRLATDICPYNPEGVFRYVNLLLQQSRVADAIAVAENGAKSAPDDDNFRNLVAQLSRMQRN